MPLTRFGLTRRSSSAPRSSVRRAARELALARPCLLFPGDIDRACRARRGSGASGSMTAKREGGEPDVQQTDHSRLGDAHRRRLRRSMNELAELGKPNFRSTDSLFRMRAPTGTVSQQQSWAGRAYSVESGTVKTRSAGKRRQLYRPSRQRLPRLKRPVAKPGEPCAKRPSADARPPLATEILVDSKSPQKGYGDERILWELSCDAVRPFANVDAERGESVEANDLVVAVLTQEEGGGNAFAGILPCLLAKVSVESLNAA